ncbi:MAG TPA: type II toxin-antitoxin system VapC family toxin [Thermoanaerobaculia bacterium]|nr:type II toxin-antitoxin system VapC family toxin [Thermoanaerobaculia bacterium]
MRIAVDSSVLLDVLTGDPSFGLASREALRQAYDAGILVACEVVWGEVRAHFPEEVTFRSTLATLGVIYEPMRHGAAELAGELWRKYCLSIRRKRDRDRIVADFLIGAHAQVQTDALLSRDRGFFLEHFKGLRLIDPTKT